MESVFETATKEGAYDLEASVRFLGEDLVCTISGGERPHVGAVAMAQPRPSLRDAATTSATASVFCMLGHKEDEMAKKAAETLAARLETNVVVVAGAHWDEIPPEGIGQVMRNCDRLVEMILKKVQS